MKRMIMMVMAIAMTMMASVVAHASEVGPVSETTDYTAMVSTFAGLVAVVVAVTEMIKTGVSSLSGIWTQIVSWSMGVIVAIAIWALDVGVMSDMTWWVALLYGFGASLASNGVASTGMIEWILSTINSRK